MSEITAIILGLIGLLLLAETRHWLAERAWRDERRELNNRLAARVPAEFAALQRDTQPQREEPRQSEPPVTETEIEPVDPVLVAESQADFAGLMREQIAV